LDLSHAAASYFRRFWLLRLPDFMSLMQAFKLFRTHSDFNNSRNYHLSTDWKFSVPGVVVTIQPKPLPHTPT